MRRIRRGPSPQRKRPGWGYKHRVLAKEVVAKAAMCAHAFLGGCKGPLQADHIIPLSMGGRTERSNYQALCMKHNVAKGGVNRMRGKGR